jgi:polar amino acid transport system permease protein
MSLLPDRAVGSDAPDRTADRRIGRVLTHRGAAIGSLIFPPTGIPAVIESIRASRLEKAGRIEEARIAGQKAKNLAWVSLGVGLAAYFVGFMVWLFLTNHQAVLHTYFQGRIIFGWKFWHAMLNGFWVNVQVFLIAEVLVLVWSLVVAVIRLLPGRSAAPMRWLATAYVDVFRGIPSILVIYLLGFGMPLAKVPYMRDFSRMEFAVLGLTLTYGAYVSEVYKAGIDSVHWGQTAAARSLGLGYGQTLRHVVIPQALRRIGPPLLNDFIGLQKDTAIIGFIGVFDVLSTARFINNNYATFSAYTIATVLFLAATIPFTRYLDHMLKAQKLRTQGGT